MPESALETAPEMLARKRVADALCMDCGLCCDGTFFGSVAIVAEERENLVRVGLRVVDADGTPAMPQPCTALRGCLCSVYEDRPAACRQYECTLRESVLSGGTSDASARLSIARMRALLIVIRHAFDVPTASIWEAILAVEEPPLDDPRSAAGRTFDEGVRALSELVELARIVFEPRLGGGR